MMEFGENDPRAQERFLRVLEGGGECRRPRCVWYAVGLACATVLVVLALAALVLALVGGPAGPVEHKKPEQQEKTEQVAEWRLGWRC